MAKYDLKLKTTDAGTQKARTLTMSNVNPEASANVLKSFTQQLNQLTTNTYVETDYIITTNLDTETPPIDTRLTPTMTFPNNQPPTSLAGLGNTIVVNHTGDGNVYIRRNSGCDNISFIMWNSSSFYMEGYSGKTPTTGTYVVGLTGTETYKPLEIEYTLE